ncbi:MAG: EpsI family protein [Candidatus Eisenbacteria bacterium]|nr:EpsI family protein [Candidatus Eisenbacteria bacterium]
MLIRPRVVASLLLLGLLAAYVLLLPPGTAGETHLASLPAEIAGFRSTDLELEQAVLDDLNPDGILVRRYERAGVPPVWLVIVYFENARLGAHDPELCYRSQGFEVGNRPDATLTTGLGPVPCRVFDAVRGERNELVNYFWYTAGRRALAEVKTFRDEMFFQGLKSNRSFGAFVRISTLVEGDRAVSEAVLNRFVQELAPVLPQMFPEEG